MGKKQKSEPHYSKEGPQEVEGRGGGRKKALQEGGGGLLRTWEIYIWGRRALHPSEMLFQIL